MANKAIRIDPVALDAWRQALGVELDKNALVTSALRTAASMRQREASSMATGIEWILDALRAGHVRSTDVQVVVEHEEVRIVEPGGHVVAVLSPNPRVRAS